MPPDVPSYLSSQGTLSDRQEAAVRTEGGHQANGHLESNGRASARAQPLKRGDLSAWVTQVCWWVFWDLTCASSTRSLLGLPSPNPDMVALPALRAAKHETASETHTPPPVPGAGRLPHSALPASQSRKCPEEWGKTAQWFGVSLSKPELGAARPAWCEGRVREGSSLDLWVISPGTNPWEEPPDECPCAARLARSFHPASSEVLCPPQGRSLTGGSLLQVFVQETPASFPRWKLTVLCAGSPSSASGSPRSRGKWWRRLMAHLVPRRQWV